MNTNIIIAEILKEAGNTALSPGVTLEIYDTKDKMGFTVKIEGSFRHGGTSMKEVIKTLRNTFKKLDIDHPERA